MKTILKTIVLIILIVAAIIFSLKMYNKSHTKNEENIKEELDNNSEIVKNLMNKVYSSKYYRDAKFSKNRIDDRFVLEYTIDNLTDKDYQKKVVEHKKSLCEVTNRILFTSTSDCTIRIIKNEVFKNKIQKDFNIEKDIKYVEFKYKGYYCKNDGKKYYCFMSNYKENIKNFSSIKEAYKEDNKIIIYEYYFFIDLNDKDTCYLYLNKDYCDKKDIKQEIVIDEDVIINNGVLYRHEFEQTEDNYYFLQNYIV